MTSSWAFLQFVVCAGLIASAGFALIDSTRRLARAYGWSSGWVGLAVLATVTSLPELATGISAVRWARAPDVAVGNALGACVVNLAFLAVVDALQRTAPMYRRASDVHLLSAGFGVVMLGFVTMSLLMGSRAPAHFNVGVYSPVLLATYVLALRSVFAHERSSPEAPDGRGGPTREPSSARQWRRFGLATLVVLVAGTWLPFAAVEMARVLGLSQSLVGAVFVSLATTLPEIAVTLAALRAGALDLAIGNLLGSNLFNAAILAVDDVFYTRGPLLSDVSPVHAESAATALLMTGLVIVGLVMRPQGRVLRAASWVSVALLAAYALHATLHYLAAGPATASASGARLPFDLRVTSDRSAVGLIVLKPARAAVERMSEGSFDPARRFRVRRLSVAVGRREENLRTATATRNLP